MSKFHISTQTLQGNALFSGKIYCNFFTRPPVATNFKSANCPRLTLSPFPSFPKNILFCFVLVFCFVLCPMLTLRFWSPVHLSKNKYFHQSWTILHQRDKSWWIGNKIFCFVKLIFSRIELHKVSWNQKKKEKFKHSLCQKGTNKDIPSGLRRWTGTVCSILLARTHVFPPRPHGRR